MDLSVGSPDMGLIERIRRFEEHYLRGPTINEIAGITQANSGSLLRIVEDNVLIAVEVADHAQIREDTFGPLRKVFDNFDSANPQRQFVPLEAQTTFELDETEFDQLVNDGIFQSPGIAGSFRNRRKADSDKTYQLAKNLPALLEPGTSKIYQTTPKGRQVLEEYSQALSEKLGPQLLKFTLDRLRRGRQKPPPGDGPG